MDIYSELEKRILVLDGAMGTMIQTYQLSEEDYRGTQFRNCTIPQIYTGPILRQGAILLALIVSIQIAFHRLNMACRKKSTRLITKVQG